MDPYILYSARYLFKSKIVESDADCNQILPDPLYPNITQKPSNIVIIQVIVTTLMFAQSDPN